MATVTSSVPELYVEGKLIIFPAYTFYLQEHGYIISQKNDKVSNRKLNELLMKANLAKALNKEYSIPHIAIYEDRKWRTFNVGQHKQIIINAGKYGQYCYYPTLINNIRDEAAANVMVAFLSQYSSAKLSIRYR